MQKIKSIKKDKIIYHTTKSELLQRENSIAGNYYRNTYVDKIGCNWVDKEQTFDNQNSGVMLTYTMALVYQGYKDNKLVFEMFNPDLITYDDNN